MVLGPNSVLNIVCFATSGVLVLQSLATHQLASEGIDSNRLECRTYTFPEFLQQGCRREPLSTPFGTRFEVFEEEL